ncbi:GNAT family N-acetyltransferase [Mucilaginibacter sp. PPCGB 2223]|uniref:GNAT family N-acetyltransferase n=1 Tax=Mucilaginibacter sp. PPCGB 2223 TaxID=1886027 RepID=UPI0008250469|nr:GNAT family N-acetyltransferase [Mucilaginibacter sp. PPCGB 2223]OCX54818.1 GNAT family N-acetyltransferase [Mucilaginibacter sp. PPCGB 2223]
MIPVSRIATLADIPYLNQLIALSVKELSKDYYTPQQVESSIKYIFGVDTQLIADGTYYVLTADDTIAACGGWSKRNTLYGGDQFKEEADPLLDPATDAARIRAFFVHPAYARRGLGRTMINICEEAARREGFTSFELGSTLPGEPLYRAMGYEAIEQHNVPMPDGEFLQVIKMRKAPQPLEGGV